MKKNRNISITMDLVNGATARATAKKYNISEVRVREIAFTTVKRLCSYRTSSLRDLREQRSCIIPTLESYEDFHK